MKRIIAALSLSAVLLSGCDKGREPMKQLPPEPTSVKTSSTYTGTTVDFIHVTTRPMPTVPGNNYDMPDFPDFDGAGNPFDAEFYELFGANADHAVTFPAISAIDMPEGQFPSYTSESADMPFSASLPMTAETAASETSAPADELPSEVTQVVTVNGVFPDYDTPEMGTVTTPANTSADSDDVTDTFPSAETFDIRDYMPDANDYPAFTTINIGEYF